MTYIHFMYNFKVIWPAFWSDFTLNVNIQVGYILLL